MNWRKITNDREKYAAYLCSREWSVLKEAVHNRARGKCERCKSMPIDAVHHLTYKRKYRERLEDLQAICSPCHEFTHGKADMDPSLMRDWLGYLRLSDHYGQPVVPKWLVCVGTFEFCRHEDVGRFPQAYASWIACDCPTVREDFYESSLSLFGLESTDAAANRLQPTA